MIRSGPGSESSLITTNIAGPLTLLTTIHNLRSSFLISVLEIQALDRGSPVLSSSILVNVDIQDANDNAPIFPEGNYTVYVQEDKPYGHILLRFSVTDSDDSPNGAPFTW